MIDSHQHFWQLDKPFNYHWLDAPELAPIRKDYLPDDLLPLLDHCGIDQSIFVQTQHDLEENRWTLKLAEEHGFLAGIVGWVDLASEACEEQILEFKDHPKFLGVRHVTHDEADDDFIIRPDILRGLGLLEKHQVPFDLLFFVKHLRHADTLGKMFPNLPMVIDHLAKPHIKEQSMDGWQDDFRAAAKHENIYCKLSGMITEADWKEWKPSDLRPYIESALESFGPERCMYGSDWPVCELAGTYQEVFDALKEALGGISEAESHEIFEGTARRFYGLKAKNTL